MEFGLTEGVGKVEITFSEVGNIKERKRLYEPFLLTYPGKSKAQAVERRKELLFQTRSTNHTTTNAQKQQQHKDNKRHQTAKS